MKLCLDLIIRNNLYLKNIFINIDKSVIKFINFMKKILIFREPTNIDIS